MNTGDNPERLLAAALNAQAAGDQAPVGKPIVARLPVLRVLLFAVILGFLAGGIAGVLSLR